MTLYIALLRAINVGGRTVKMDRLRDLFEQVGFSAVETFIASGNVIFAAAEQPTAEMEARIADESRRKAAAFASVTDRDDFRTGFSAPLRDFRVTARFGGQRIVDGRPRPPHYGIDLAAPTGTPVTSSRRAI